MSDKQRADLADLPTRELLAQLADPDAGSAAGCAASLAGAVAAALGLAAGSRKEAEGEFVETLRARLAALAELIDRNRAAAGQAKEQVDAGTRALSADVALTPVQTISESLQVLDLADRLLRGADRSGRADAGAAVALAHASILAAYLNARDDLELLGDDTVRAKARGLIDEALLRSSEKVRETMTWLLHQYEGAQPEEGGS